MLPSLIEFLGHIQTELGFILRASDGLSAEEFLADELRTRAVVRSLEIIGEASKRIPEEFRYAHPEFAWKGFAGIRDRLIHHYWGVDPILLWEAVSVDAPVNKEWIDLIITSERDKPDHDQPPHHPVR
jgi:uncharacterized protein with HEPN domain